MSETVSDESIGYRRVNRLSMSEPVIDELTG